ncbi:hypothetical protein FRC19_007609 [Serendipita sp. 401]|nr:hypothetical protein FRC19_007609 [Serendipita sp. 401]KAG9020540.1 hypothetical protein FS842_007216 [Serendipita sp. 407]
MFLARTFLSHSEQSLIKSLENIKLTPSSTTLIALHAPAPKLQPLFDQISKFPSKNIGCLSAPISSKHLISLSLFNIPSSIEHRVWRSTIPGTERAQVGRWYSREQIKRERSEGSMESSPDWNSDTARPPALPHALQGFVDAKRQISGLLFFTDDAPQGLATSLNHYFPKTAKIGSIASSTPFITGRPFTIFESGSIYSDGAVGVAIAGTKALGIHPNFSSLRPIGIPLLTTSAASNIIYTMNNLPAADILAQLLGSRVNANVEDRPTIYLGVLDAQGKITRTFSVLAGSPSRGALLLDGEHSPTVGSKVQFLISAHDTLDHFDITTPPMTQEGSAIDAHFACLSPMDANSSSSMTPSNDETIIYSRFLVASENGFMMDRGEGLWECKIPFVGASMRLR